MPLFKPTPESNLPQPSLTMEDIAQTNPELHAELEAVFAETPLEQITEETGLGLDELSQPVSFNGESGQRSGTLAAAIAHPDCPAGGMVRSRYARGGLAKVEELFEDWKADGLNIDVKISTVTRQREETRLAQPTSPNTSETAANHTADEERLKKKLEPAV